jgi:hypothetical protein
MDDVPTCTVPGCDQPVNGALIRDPDLRRRALTCGRNEYCMPHLRLVNQFADWLGLNAGTGFDRDRVGLVRARVNH